MYCYIYALLSKQYESISLLWRQYQLITEEKGKTLVKTLFHKVLVPGGFWGPVGLGGPVGFKKTPHTTCIPPTTLRQKFKIAITPLSFVKLHNQRKGPVLGDGVRRVSDVCVSRGAQLHLPTHQTRRTQAETPPHLIILRDQLLTTVSGEDSAQHVGSTGLY